jgi:long-chain acyl-CoA synthetase
VSLLRDSPDWNIAECAVLKVGGVHVPLAVSVNPEKLQQVLVMVRPSLILVDSESTMKRVRPFLSLLSQNIVVLNIREVDGHTTSQSRELAELHVRMDAVRPDDTAVILFTSGSTSEPKGVLLSHRSILIAADEFAQSDVFRGVTRSLSVLPMGHSAARKVNYACQLQGITICYAAPSHSLLHNLQEFGVQHVAVVPYLLRKLQAEILDNKNEDHSLRTVTCGGAPLPGPLWEWFDQRGVRIYEVYGLTETASLLTYSTDKVRRPGCVGQKAEPGGRIAHMCDNDSSYVMAHSIGNYPQQPVCMNRGQLVQLL